VVIDDLDVEAVPLNPLVGFERDRVISTLVTTRRSLEQGPFGAQPIVEAIEQEGIPV
jgi:hypothetical protein